MGDHIGWTPAPLRRRFTVRWSSEVTPGAVAVRPARCWPAAALAKAGQVEKYTGGAPLRRGGDSPLQYDRLKR
jgi:hypothetical protein